MCVCVNHIFRSTFTRHPHHCKRRSLRCKRFRAVSEQRKTEERDSRFLPREKWNERQKMKEGREWKSRSNVCLLELTASVPNSKAKEVLESTNKSSSISINTERNTTKLILYKRENRSQISSWDARKTVAAPSYVGRSKQGRSNLGALKPQFVVITSN